MFVGTDRDDRKAMWYYLRNVSSCPEWKCMKEYLVIPPGPGVNVSSYPDAHEYKKRETLFAAGRAAFRYDHYWQSKKVIHFISMPELGFRLLEHFYTFLHFEDVAMDRRYKRFVRDYIHYIDVIFCKAAIIVDKLMQESQNNGKFSTFHIRR